MADKIKINLTGFILLILQKKLKFREIVILTEGESKTIINGFATFSFS